MFTYTRKKVFTLFIPVALLAWLSVACARGEAPLASSDAVFEEAPAEEMAEAGPALVQTDSDFSREAVLSAGEDEAFDEQAQGVELPQERLIIRTGELSIVAADTEETLAEIADLTEEFGGWVVNSSVSQFNEAKRGNISIRVPAERFDEMIARVKEGAVEVTREFTSGQDVTEEYVDVSARLANLEATADRVRSFLDEAQTVEEALAVNAELSRLEGEIEAMKGRLQYLSQSAAFSTLHVDVTPDIENPSIQVGGWRPREVANNAIESLVGVLRGLGNFVIWATLFILPLALIVGLPLYFLGRWGMRRWRARRTAAG